MSEFRFESPVTDDVFEAWLSRADTNSVKRRWGLEKSYVSVAESVENVEKYAAFFFSSKKTSAGSSVVKGKEITVPAAKLRGMTFYKFTKALKPEDWKEKRQEVPIYDIKLENCKKCNGRGRIDCRECKGKGKTSIEVNVSTDGQKPKREKFDFQCDACGGTGAERCSSCGGVGGLYKYYMGTVPFKTERETIPYFFFKKEFKFLGDRRKKEELEDLISSEKIAGIQIRNIKDLNEKHLKSALGFWSGDTKKWMAETLRQFQILEKQSKRGDPEKPQYPVYIFPLLKLSVNPPKGKRFFLYSVGSGKAFSVFDEGFK